MRARLAPPTTGVRGTGYRLSLLIDIAKLKIANMYAMGRTYTIALTS